MIKPNFVESSSWLSPNFKSADTLPKTISIKVVNKNLKSNNELVLK